MNAARHHDDRPVIPAAGGLLWRRSSDSGLEVLLVHRAKYDDWSWPKGKLDPGETWVGAAAREVEEETGLRPRFSIPLPASIYRLPRGDEKHVQYWAGTVADGDGRLLNEIDKVLWVSADQARTQLTAPRLVEQLEALIEADATGSLDTWPLLVVRHAQAERRDDWDGSDCDRPLTNAGHERAAAIVPILRAFDARSVVSSGSERCIQTMMPYLTANQIALKTKRGLSEEGFAADPTKALKHVTKLLEAGAPAALCTHRPVLPAVLQALAEHCAPGSASDELVCDLASRGLEKGEVLACHVRGQGPSSEVVAVQRFRPSTPGQ